MKEGVMKQNNNILIPADIPTKMHQRYHDNYNAVTQNSFRRLLLFSFDQKIEHLYDDFYGSGIEPDTADPIHAFTIATQGTIGALATHFGLIARYASQYPMINYVVKLTGKTTSIPLEYTDPYSAPLCTIDKVIALQATNTTLKICGVGITIYLGSVYEGRMLEFAAQQIFQAHQNGLLAILWVYYRGRCIKIENDPPLLAGAVGLANSLGADFVKIKTPNLDIHNELYAPWITNIVKSAGNTGVIFSGGAQKDSNELIKEIQVHLDHGVSGCALGRNIFQRKQHSAIELTNAISSLLLNRFS
jgi:DhnA family fructose-bisphosphate aldolase class Ia